MKMSSRTIPCCRRGELRSANANACGKGPNPAPVEGLAMLALPRNTNPGPGCSGQWVDKRQPLLPEQSQLHSICKQRGLTKRRRSGPPGVTHSQLTSQLHTKICQVLQESIQGQIQAGYVSTVHLHHGTLPLATASELFLGQGQAPWGCSREQLKILDLFAPFKPSTPGSSALLPFSGLGGFWDSTVYPQVLSC